MQAPQPFWMIVTDVNENTVMNCTVIPGSTSTCTNTGATNIKSPFAPAFAGGGSNVLVANSDTDRTSDLTSCDYTNGVLSNCLYTATKFESFGQPTGVIQEGSYAYYSITNLNAYSECSSPSWAKRRT